MSTIERPAEVQINAWAGGAANRDLLPLRTPWAQREVGRKPSTWLAPAASVDARNWNHPEVGWGLVLREKSGLSHEELARADDAPEAIRRLLASRPGSPVLRWNPELQQGYLRRYYPGTGKAQDLATAAPRPGTSEGRIPRYLLIYSTPEQIPWPVQYALNMSTFVGRLDLPPGPGLDNYVNALIEDWPGAQSDPRAPLVWNVDHGAGDITWLMARGIGGRLWELFEKDSELAGRRRLNGADATAAQLVTGLQEHKPGLVVTTSHGMTGPLDDADAIRASLGLPVDVNHQPLALDHIAKWRPAGAIWYAHACCSAGSDQVSRYEQLMGEDTSIGKILRGVASAAQSMVAPLPRQLLGATNPLRAFVGHVEPTFDWTLRDPATGQVLTHVLLQALYNRLYQADRRTPIGFALHEVFIEAGAFYGQWQDAITAINHNQAGARDWALYRQLVAMDRQTLVILGDPTVSLAARG